MLYTIMPPEMMTVNDNKNEHDERECITYRGIRLEGVRTSDGFVVSRIISSDPLVFLEKSISPGSVIRKENF